MPSKSPAQHRLMEAAAHTKGGFGGVPQNVGKEFAAADKAKGDPKPPPKPTPQGHHMRERKDAGRTTAQVAAEFGTSKTTAHRRMKAHDALREGYTREERDD